MSGFAFELTNKPDSRNNMGAWLWLDDQTNQSLEGWHHWDYTYKDSGKVTVFLIQDRDLATTFALTFSEVIEAKGQYH